MRPYELIKKKRDGGILTSREIGDLFQGYIGEKVPDYQMAALCMAIFFRGLSSGELDAWTEAMLRSGSVLDFSKIPGKKVDKHSTGGVGDKVSLALAPLVAACGIKVPMVCGRGLGHTGGTIDKLESIPGFQVSLGVEQFQQIVASVGTCLMGQTEFLAPADKRLYALRDVTATVDCIPLIAASILSKKLAEGIDALVLDIKVGAGAFMKTQVQAQELARTMIAIGTRMGKEVVALLTAMEQPLGRTVGNALEVKEAVEVLRGKAAEDLTECTMALAVEMILLAGIAKSNQEARSLLVQCINSGAAIEKFAEMVGAQGGNASFLEDENILPQAKMVVPIICQRKGYITFIDAEEIGLAAMALGAGRENVNSLIDPAVGFVLEKKVGDQVSAGEVLIWMHVNDETKCSSIEQRVQRAFRIEHEPGCRKALILERLGSAQE